MFFKRILRPTACKNATLIRFVGQLSENSSKIDATSVATLENSSVKEQNEPKSVLEPISDADDISLVSSYLKPTFNFAAYVNKSETLQELVKLGVDLHKIELKKDAAPFILKLKFEDIREHISYLKYLGLSKQTVARIITENPFIFQEEIENFEVRLTYLKYKKFTKDMQMRILEKNPLWLSHTTQQIDERLGFFQKQFQLSGDEVRQVAVSRPKLITYDLQKVKLNKFVVKEEMGFTDDEIKSVILKKPSIFHMGQSKLLKTFEFFHKTMNIPIEDIVKTPEVLTCREQRVKYRHLFLKELGRDQYNPKKPKYVSLIDLISSDDSTFATEIAKSSVQTYNMFIKSL